MLRVVRVVDSDWILAGSSVEIVMVEMVEMDENKNMKNKI